MKATRRMYTVALGAAGLVLAGSMVGAVAYAANGGPSGNNDSPWSQGLSGGMMGGGWADGNSGGMMGQGWSQGDSTDTPAVTLDQATKIASDWVAAKYPGATLGTGTHMPIGYLFVASKDGKVVAHVMVNDDTGQVFAGNGRNFGGMMGRGWSNGPTGTAGGGMMGQGRRPASSMMSGRSA